MSTPKPTDEQTVIVDACLNGGGLVIEAAAGSGKTTTLKMIANATDRRGMYLAYNAAIKNDALKSFPQTVRCVTSHGLAYGPVGVKYKSRIGGKRVTGQQAARILNVNEPLRLHKDMAPLAPAQLTRIATEAVTRFCYSADDEIAVKHVPHINGLEDRELRATLVDAVVPIARKVWADILNPAGELHFSHDHYLKMFQLSRPVLDVDYLLVDEAQDLNPAVQAIVGYQKDAQIILVGDRCQQLYSWRGAVDSMASFAGQRLQLTQSFRFGHSIAAEANKWLEILNADLRVRGFDKVHSTVGPHLSPDAILCRTNGAAISHVIDGLGKGRRVALVGGGGSIASLARAARDLQAGRPCDHPELLAFASWFEVQDYCQQDSAGSDLKVLVDLVDKHGADALIALVDRLCHEDKADLIVSTAHKSKGREWGTVKIATDFREPKPDDNGNPGEISREDAMLAYVSVTRAKTHLDRDGLAWVDRYVDCYQPPIADLIDASSLGTPEAAMARESVTAAGVLTGMPEEQADWDADDADLLAPYHCRRCGSDRCLCDPAAARRFTELTGIPAGARASYAHNRAQGRDKVESIARALIGIPDGM